MERERQRDAHPFWCALFNSRAPPGGECAPGFSKGRAPAKGRLLRSSPSPGFTSPYFFLKSKDRRRHHHLWRRPAPGQPVRRPGRPGPAPHLCGRHVRRQRGVRLPPRRRHGLAPPGAGVGLRRRGRRPGRLGGGRPHGRQRRRRARPARPARLPHRPPVGPARGRGRDGRRVRVDGENLPRPQTGRRLFPDFLRGLRRRHGRLCGRPVQRLGPGAQSGRGDLPLLQILLCGDRLESSPADRVGRGRGDRGRHAGGWHGEGGHRRRPSRLPGL